MASNELKNGMRPVHPGEVLKADFMEPLGLSANRLAALLQVPANRVSTIVAGKRDVTADTALRLSAVLGASAQFWMNLQVSFDLRTAEIAAGAEIAKLERYEAEGSAVAPEDASSD